MYIKEVGLKNYQIHSNTVVRFDEKDNAIIGASDSGKTALKRACLALAPRSRAAS